MLALTVKKITVTYRRRWSFVRLSYHLERATSLHAKKFKHIFLMDLQSLLIKTKRQRARNNPIALYLIFLTSKESAFGQLSTSRPAAFYDFETRAREGACRKRPLRRLIFETISSTIFLSKHATD